MAALIVGAGGQIKISQDDLEYVIGKSIVLDLNDQDGTYEFTVQEQV